jgi:nucleoside-diphosphate-sugar epimerase
LFRLVLESAPAGFRWHGVGEEQVRFRDIAQTIGRRLGVPVKSLTPDEAQGYFGPFASFGTLNNPASNAQTRSLLKWEPIHPTLLEDLEGPHYFTTA